MVMAVEVWKDGRRISTQALLSSSFVIGRDAACDRVLEHPSISRRHAEIVRSDDGEIRVCDLDSTYGTTLEGVRVTEATVVPEGAALQLGLSSRTFKVVASPQEEEEEGGDFPASFGKRRSRPGTEDEASKRRRHQREIAAMTREMLEKPPSWEEREEPPPENEELGRRGFPASREVVFGGLSKKTVSCVDVDPGGARVAVGSLDKKIRLYDFGGMDGSHLPFASKEPDDGHAVVALSFSPSGDRFLCCTGSAQPQIWTRDLSFLLKFNRGDPYVTDATRTTGHTTMVTGGQWQPHEKMRCGTASVDGTVRLWDLCGKTGLRDFLYCEQTIKCKDAKARKTAATSMGFSPDGKYVAAGCADGSLQLFQVRGRAHAYRRPDARAVAHAPGTDAAGACVSCARFSPDGNSVATRGDDGYARLWDVRKLAMVAEFPDLPTHHATANLAWSPDGALVCAGDDRGRLNFFSAAGAWHESRGGYEKVASLESSNASICCVVWHPRIRQIVCGAAEGVVKTFYDPEISTNGALLSSNRKINATRRNADDIVVSGAGTIINPNALPMFRNDQALRKGRYAKTRNDPIKSRKPDPPLERGQQGRNAGPRSTFCQYYVETHLPQSIREQNPREELLKYADAPPIFRTDATFYRDKEGNKVFHTQTAEEEAEQASVDDQKKNLLSHAFSKPGPS